MKTRCQRETPASWLENVGVSYYQHLARKAGLNDKPALNIDDLPDDSVLCAIAEHLTHFAAIIAFGVGALTTVVSVWFEWMYRGEMDTVIYYTAYTLIVLVMFAIEMLVLFWLGLRTVHGFACLTGQYHQEDDLLPESDSVPNMLARAALEVPDPVIHYMGIDPTKHIPKTQMLIVGLLYKAKVLLTSLIIKLVLIRLFGKGGSRLGFAWVAIPVTGIWDAITMYKVAKEAKLRLFGYSLARYIANDIIKPDIMERLSDKAKEGAIRAVATTSVLTQNYHPNMMVLLLKLSQTFDIKEQADYDNWQDFLKILNEVEQHERYFLLDLLCVSAAFDGHLSNMEREHLPDAFAEHTDVYMERLKDLIEALLNGELHKAKTLCKLDFEAG